MKILSGTFKGTKIGGKPVKGLRPTSDKVRQAIMNSLGPSIHGKNGLDLFAGSGALGLEALSCGAAHMTFVEIKKSLCRDISEAIHRLHVESQTRVYCAEASIRLKRLSNEGTSFDFILADPPYEKGWGRKIIKLVQEPAILNPRALLIIETSKREVLPPIQGFMVQFSKKAYGDTQLTFYQLKAQDA